MRKKVNSHEKKIGVVMISLTVVVMCYIYVQKLRSGIFVLHEYACSVCRRIHNKILIDDSQVRKMYHKISKNETKIFSSVRSKKKKI